MNSAISVDAIISESARIGDNAKIWGLAQVREQAALGDNCTIGRGVYIGPEVRIGDNCKIQNGAQIYEPATIGAGVFVGPGVILTNDRFPRAVTPERTLKSKSDWTAEGVTIGEGASIGAGAVCVGPITIGPWSVIGAGAVVTKSVPDHALVLGNPARQVGWAGRSGFRLQEKMGFFECPATRERYREIEGLLELYSTL